MADEAAPEYDVEEHLKLVGLVCTQWAYLEYLLAVAIWWELNLLDGSKDGLLITSSFQADKLARMARDLAHRKLTDTKELDTMKHIADEVERLTGERNLAVHGLPSSAA
jgi:hypothetical protein